MRTIAVLIYALFILFLFLRDRKLRPMASAALWIPLLWIMIIGSRPIGNWLGVNIPIETPQDYVEGSPVDRNFLLLLIIAGFAALLIRRVRWTRLFASNRWFFLFFFYCGLSILWSDYSFVSFKRWIKDAGNVIMVLVILTESNPVQAFRAVFSRYIYLAVPLSVLFIKYFPNIGRYYNRWTWEPAYCGVTLEKNALGPLAFCSAMFLLWDLSCMSASKEGKFDRVDFVSRVILLLMSVWLLIKAQSSTSLVCLILGACILFCMRLPVVRRNVRHLGLYSLVLIILIIVLYSIPGAMELLSSAVGRDVTLTGRTDLWSEILKEKINPIIGTGYESFWMGPRAEHMWEKYYFHPNQAHNGYIEIYLNGGIIGLCLLLAMVIAAGGKLKRDLPTGNSEALLRFSFFVVVLFSNWTEATFNKLALLWIVLIMGVLDYHENPGFGSPKREVCANVVPIGKIPPAGRAWVRPPDS